MVWASHPSHITIMEFTKGIKDVNVSILGGLHLGQVAHHHGRVTTTPSQIKESRCLPSHREAAPPCRSCNPRPLQYHTILLYHHVGDGHPSVAGHTIRVHHHVAKPHPWCRSYSPSSPSFGGTPPVAGQWLDVVCFVMSSKRPNHYD